MKEQILDFIHRRFPKDCYWTDGNCYWFAVILKERFGKFNKEGKIWYDPIEGHFLFEFYNIFYDYTGVVTIPKDELIDLEKYAEIDPIHFDRIMRDCIL